MWFSSIIVFTDSIQYVICEIGVCVQVENINMFTDISGEWVCMRAYVCVHNSNSNSNNNNNNTMLVKMENQSVLLVYVIDTNNNL